MDEMSSDRLLLTVVFLSEILLQEKNRNEMVVVEVRGRIANMIAELDALE